MAETPVDEWWQSFEARTPHIAENNSPSSDFPLTVLDECERYAEYTQSLSPSGEPITGYRPWSYYRIHQYTASDARRPLGPIPVPRRRRSSSLSLQQQSIRKSSSRPSIRAWLTQPCSVRVGLNLSPYQWTTVSLSLGPSLLLELEKSSLLTTCSYSSAFCTLHGGDGQFRRRVPPKAASLGELGY